jgi:hypothetical protein
LLVAAEKQRWGVTNGKQRKKEATTSKQRTLLVAVGAIITKQHAYSRD